MSPKDKATDAAAYEPVVKPVVGFDDPRSRTVGEFCAIEHLSLSSYFLLKRRKRQTQEAGKRAAQTRAAAT